MNWKWKYKSQLSLYPLGQLTVSPGVEDIQFELSSGGWSETKHLSFTFLYTSSKSYDNVLYSWRQLMLW